MTISFDGNFRSTLWDFDGARDFCTECLPYVDVLFGIEPYHLWKDPSSHEKGDVKDGLSSHAGRDEHDSIFREFVRRYPNLKCIARHMRYAPSSSENSLKAYMWYQGETLESPVVYFSHFGSDRRRRCLCSRPDLCYGKKLRSYRYALLCRCLQRIKTYYTGRRKCTR